MKKRSEMLRELKRIPVFKDKLKAVSEYCSTHCRVVDYNSNCGKCSLSKYIEKVDPTPRLLCWDCDKLNDCPKSPVKADVCEVYDCEEFIKYEL